MCALNRRRYSCLSASLKRYGAGAVSALIGAGVLAACDISPDKRTPEDPYEPRQMLRKVRVIYE